MNKARSVGFLVGAIVAGSAAATSPDESVIVANPSCQEDAFTEFPGYASRNGGAITGWSFTGSAGINGSVVGGLLLAWRRRLG